MTDRRVTNRHNLRCAQINVRLFVRRRRMLRRTVEMLAYGHHFLLLFLSLLAVSSVRVFYIKRFCSPTF